MSVSRGSDVLRFVGAAVVIVAALGAAHLPRVLAGAGETAQRKTPQTRPTIVRWERVPVCLEATAGRGAGGASAINWATPRHELPTSSGGVGLQLQNDQVAVTVGGRLVAIGSDAQGRPVSAGDSSLTVWALPDCDAASYVFIAPRTDRHEEGERRWLLDPRRTLKSDDPILIEFPGTFDASTVVTLRESALVISSRAGDADERAFEYHGDPVHAFVRQGAQPKFIALIGRSNDEFFRASAAAAALQSAGDELFDLLRTRTAVGKARAFQGRYLIVEGSATGDFERHGAAVVDMITGASFFIVCDDQGTDGGRLVAASRGDASLERGGDEILAAFRYAGFTLIFDEQMTLRCDGDCHDERVVMSRVDASGGVTIVPPWPHDNRRSIGFARCTPSAPERWLRAIRSSAPASSTCRSGATRNCFACSPGTASRISLS